MLQAKQGSKSMKQKNTQRPTFFHKHLIDLTRSIFTNFPAAAAAYNLRNNFSVNLKDYISYLCSKYTRLPPFLKIKGPPEQYQKRNTILSKGTSESGKRLYVLLAKTTLLKLMTSLAWNELWPQKWRMGLLPKLARTESITLSHVVEEYELKFHTGLNM